MSTARNLGNQQNRLYEILRASVQHIVQNGRQGEWADARTSSTAIWALSSCGIQEKAPLYIHRSLERLFQSTECETDADGCSFNQEAWDTSLALLAASTARLSDFQPHVSRIQQWLRNEFFLESVRDEPWETLWTLLALLSSEKSPSDYSGQYVRSIRWLLSKRDRRGLLISAHNAALLLAVLELTRSRLALGERDIAACNRASQTSFDYIVQEFHRALEDERLWRDEPWQIGHILFGLAHSGDPVKQLYEDFGFNDELEAGLRRLWDEQAGFVDMVETTGVTVGLASYLFGRSDHLRSLMAGSGVLTRDDFHSTVSFHGDFTGRIPKVFISYSTKDSGMATRLAESLGRWGVNVWHDQTEVLVGHSIVDRVYKGIRDSDYLAIVLTRNSVESKWVRQELNAARVREIENEEVVILPLLFEECAIPTILADKRYADFRHDFSAGESELVRQLLPLNIRNPSGPRGFETCPAPPEHKKCRYCGSSRVTGALIEPASTGDDPNILCEDCGNWW